MCLINLSVFPPLWVRFELSREWEGEGDPHPGRWIKIRKEIGWGARSLGRPTEAGSVGESLELTMEK